MKIWFVVDEFPPSFGGGIGMYVDIASRGLAAEGHDVTVVTADVCEKQERVNDKLLHHRFMRPTAGTSTKLGHFITLYKEYYYQVSELIERFGKPDVIEFPEYNAIGYYILQAKHLGEALFQGIKMVVHCHTPNFELSAINRTPEYAFPMYWIGRMEMFCMKAADALLTQSHFLHDHLLPYAGEKTFDIIPLPYHFNAAGNRYQCGQHLLYAGRLEYRKGVYQLLKPMAQLWEEGEKTQLVLVGGDVMFSPKGQTIGDMIRQKYGKWIEAGLLVMKDKVPPDELERLYAESKAIIIPSIYENYPYTNVMAMANGVPVIVSRQGGQAEAVAQHGVNGFIFDWDQPDDCYRVLKEALSKSDDELKVIGENGYQRIRSCCELKNNIPLREAYYQKVLQEPDDYRPYPFLTDMPRTALPAKVADSAEVAGLLSVVIPYYNLGKTVEETVNSILNSDYDQKKIEIILLDDGSTDEESIRKAQVLENKHECLRVVRIANGGLANARNVGITLAKGEYVCFLDADDTVAPNYFSACIDLLKRHSNVSFVYSWVQYFEGSDAVWTTFDTEMPYLCAQNQLTCMAVARRKDYLAFAHNHVDMEYGLEDYDGWLGMVENGRLGVCIPETLLNYRVRAASMARSMSRDAILYLRTNLKKLHPALYHRYGEELYALLLQNGSSMHWGSPLGEAASFGHNEALIAELNAIKNSRIYRVFRRVAKVLYRCRVVRWLVKRI